MPIPNMNPSTVPEENPTQSLLPQQGTQGGQGLATMKEDLAESIAQIPIEKLMEIAADPDKLAQMIVQLGMQQGMSEDEATAFSITLMKVIFERIQNETGQPITNITGQAGQAQPGQPGAAPSVTQDPRAVLGG